MQTNIMYFNMYDSNVYHNVGIGFQQNSSKPLYMVAHAKDGRQLPIS